LIQAGLPIQGQQDSSGSRSATLSYSPCERPEKEKTREDGKEVSRMRRKWDARKKAKIVLEGLMGGCVNDLCRSHDLRPGQYYKWRGQFLEQCHQIFEKRPNLSSESELVAENEELKKLVGELTLELTSGKSSR